MVMEQTGNINLSTADDVELITIELKQSKKKRILKRLGGAILVLGIVVGCASIGVILYLQNVKQETHPNISEMVKDMDKTANPCDDFYQYACGGYISRHEKYYETYYVNKLLTLQKKNVQVTKEAIEAIQNKGSDNGALDKAAKYYSSCLNNDDNFRRSIGLSPYWKALQDIGGAPIVSRSWSSPPWSLVKALQKMHINYGTHPLFKVTVMANLKNTSRHIFVVNFPDLGLEAKIAKKNTFDVMFGIEDMDFEDQLGELSKLTQSFKDTVDDAFTDAIAAKYGRERWNVEQDLSSATYLESGIVKDAVTAAKGGIKIHSVYQTMTVQELTTLMHDRFQWKAFLGGLTNGTSNMTVSNDTIVGLLVPKSFLLSIANKLRYQSSGRLANYFAWVLLKKLSPALPDIYFNAYHKIGDIKEGHERWRACLKDTEINMPLTTGLMFVEKTVTNTTRNQTLRLLKDIHEAFRQGVKNVGWLDQTTRAAVESKVQNMIDVVADPVDIVERTALERRYADVTDSLGIADFLISCQRNLVKENLLLLDKPAHRTEWGATSSAMPLSTVNAFYDRTKNRMVVLAGIMQQPLLYADAPNYINYGKLGMVVGHEMMHGFDSKGWYFDKNGNIDPWWTKDAAKLFHHNAKCLVNQYNKYPYGTSIFDTPHVDGNKTLAENIADNGGLKYAYEAYIHRAETGPPEKKLVNLNLNGKQLFFVSFAQVWCQAISNNVKSVLLKSDTHSPNMYRVIGPLSNFKEFGKVFNCSVGSRMNPANRCEFW